jgi:hypothetical protein
MAAAANAQELQLSGGFDFGFGFFSQDTTVVAPIEDYKFIASQKGQTDFFAPGSSFTMRLYPEKPAGSLLVCGFVVRDRMLLVVNAKEKGTATIEFPNWSSVFPSIALKQTETISKKRSISDDDFAIGIWEFDMGATLKFVLSERFNVFADMGVQMSIASFIYDVKGISEKDSLVYLGCGIFEALGMQIYLTKSLYAELGFNLALNLVSNQEGEMPFPNPFSAVNNAYKMIKYEDTGVDDLGVIAPYLHIGWRIDVKRLVARMRGVSGSRDAGGQE